jgi:hypothetical protein
MVLVGLLVAISACQSSRTATPPPAPNTERTSNASAQAGETILAEAMLGDKPLKFFYTADHIQCIAAEMSVVLVADYTTIPDPVTVLVDDGLAKYTTVCLAIHDSALLQQTTRFVIEFQDGTTVPVGTNGQSAFIVPVPGMDRVYATITFYDQADQILYVQRCTSLSCK